MNNESVRMAVLRALACASSLMLATPGSVRADPAKFNIAAQPLPNALKNFAAQAKMQLLYRYDLVSHATASPISGDIEKHAALDAMLKGTGLEAVYSSEKYRHHSQHCSAAHNKGGAAGNKASAGDKGQPQAVAPNTPSQPDKKSGYVHLAQANGNAAPARNATAGSAPDTELYAATAEDRGGGREASHLDLTKHQEGSQHLRRLHHRDGLRHLPGQVSLGCVAAFAGRHHQPAAVQRRQYASFRRTHQHPHPRFDPGAHRIQRARHLLRGFCARTQFQRCVAGAVEPGRCLQESNGRHDRGRHRRHGGPAHPPAVRSGRAGDRRRTARRLRRSLQAAHAGLLGAGQRLDVYGFRALRSVARLFALARDHAHAERDHGQDRHLLLIRVRHGGTCHRQCRRQHSLYLESLRRQRLGLRAGWHPLQPGGLRP